MPQPRVRLHQIPLLILLFLVTGGETRSQTFTSLTTESPVTETGAWRSVNWIDYDRDGDLDLFVTRGLSGGQDNVLFRNDGGPGFSFTRMSGLPISQDHMPSDGSTWGDYDNDGYPDAFVVNWYGQDNLLYHNDGNGTFSRILIGTMVTDGGYSETASWGDYNNDGLVDLYVTNSDGTFRNFLYKNSGNGQFVKITTGSQSTDEGTSRGVNWVDYDDDGDLDLFIVNESGENEFLYKNMLLESGVDTFQRVTTGPLVSAGGASWSGSWADYDNDGDQDVFIANWGNQASRIFVNDGAGAFSADTASPMFTDIGYGASAGWGDFDNDGDLDLIVTHAYSGSPTTNFLYKNLLAETNSPRLERVLSGPVVTDAGFMYGTSWGDYDGDGDLDLFVARTQGENQVNALYRNEVNAGHWLTFDLRGTASNASAIGAKVRVKAVLAGTPRWQTRVVEGQSGYCGQNLQLHFGLADAATVDSIAIEWPSGFDEIFTQVAADRHLVVVENDSTPVTLVSPAGGDLIDGWTVPLRWRRSLHYPPWRLQVSSDSSFAGAMVADTLLGGDTVAVVRLEENHRRYYWRVRPDRSIRDRIWSAVRYFDTDIMAPDPAVRLHPADAGVDVPVTTTLRWTTAARASGYRVRLSTDSLFTMSLIDTSVADTTIDPGTLSALTRYFWDVQSVNPSGTGPVPAIGSFTTVIGTPEAPAALKPEIGEVEVGIPADIAWFGAERASAYQIQVSAESLFIPPVHHDGIVTDTSVRVGPLESLTWYYWRVRSINAGGESAYTDVRAFRTALAAPVPLEPADRSSQFADVRFTWRRSAPIAFYHLQYGTDSTFAAVGFEDSTITDSSLTAVSLQEDTRYHWRLRVRSPGHSSTWTDIRSFVTTPDTFQVSAEASWNLISLPGNVPDQNAAAVFPGAMTPFYAYDSGYSEHTTLLYGKGYWVRLQPSTRIAVAGTIRPLDTIDVAAGWNLVGSISLPVAVSSIGTIPAGLASSPVFGYAGTFRTVDTLLPGKGYWIRMHAAGKLVMDPTQHFTVASGLRVTTDHPEPPLPPGGGPVSDGPAANLPVPVQYRLGQNYPNPFNPSTSITFELPTGSEVRLEVFNISGERVALPSSGYRAAGIHTVVWNAGSFPGGVYFYRLLAGSFNATGRMLLVK